MHILGVSAFYHDSAACLVRDGEIVAAAQEERFSRRKHDPRFPKQAVDFCLRAARISADALDYVVYYDKPLLTFERLLMTHLFVAPRGLRAWCEAMPQWLGKKLHVPSIVRNELGYTGEVLYTEHHEAHAASAFYPSPFERAAVLTIDGVGEWSTASFWRGDANELACVGELRFPDSVGLLYSAFTYFAGFRVNSGEYKLMGLAPYGEPRFATLIFDELIDLKDDGSLRLNQDYFSYLGGGRMVNGRFAKLFGGPPREPESEITQREMDLAASIQAVTEEIVLRMARHAHKETGETNLCLAGGVALNCVANGRLLREGPFRAIWIQPAAGDAGGSLGAALSAWHRYLGQPRAPLETSGGFHGDRQRGSYLGSRFSTEEVTAYLDAQGLPYHTMQPNSRAQTVAGEVAAGKVVGYFCGRMEFGPRALGARSILADARSKETQSTLNLKVKFRESFRPFAPSVLEERVSEFFDLSCPSPYMLLVASVHESRRKANAVSPDAPMLERLKEARSDIPAVTHLDYSARVQTVGPAKQDYYDIISAFDRLTGTPVIVNTSFNVRGEPIVCTPEDAYRCFMRTDMDVLVMEDVILYKDEQPPWREGKEWRRDLILD